MGGDGTPKVRVTKENLVALPALAPYFAFGLVALAASPWLLLAAAEALDGGFYRHLRVLAALHGVALGWGTSIALGALQQMTAVVGATRLHSPGMAAAAFFPFAAGTVGLLWGFYTLAPGPLTVAAFGIPLGTGLVVYNVARTAATAQGTRRWLIIAPFVKSALVYVAAAFVAGALLAWNLTRGSLGVRWNDVFPLHISMAAGGWFFMLVLGISYHLLTFFGLTEKGAEFRFPDLVRRLIHFGLLGGVSSSVVATLATASAPGTAGGAPGLLFGAGALRHASVFAFVAAAGLFLWDARGIYVRPARQQAGPVHWYIRIAHGYLAVAAAALAAVLPAPHPRHYIALGILLGGGWLSNTILGYLHRILAFFVWHNKYWGRGREPGVPAFRDMVDRRLATAGMVLFNGGVVGVAGALYVDISVGWGAALWGVGAFVVAANLVWTMVR